MSTRLAIPAALAACVLAAPAHAATAASDWFTTDQGKVRLVAAQPFVGNQQVIELGLQFELAPGWKIYWRSPGDAGYPPRVDWMGSQNLAAAEIAWPAPMRFSVLGLETMGYEGEVVLPVHARLAHTGADATFHAALQYLTCSEICVPYQTNLTLALPAAAPAPPQAPGEGFGALIARYAARVPGDGQSAGLALLGAVLRPGNPATLELAVKTDRPLGADADAFIETSGPASFGKPSARAAGPDETLLRVPVYGVPGAAEAFAGKTLAVTLVDGERAMTGTVVPERGAPLVDVARLVPMLLVALLGGLILNVMPCVLPVLSLKLLAAIERGERPQRAVRAGFLATAAGILLSFAGLALAMIAATWAGLSVGWGMQFQSPVFLAAMAALLVLFAANLWGLYEIALPRPFAALAERAALGNVATGAFATLLATPCSAPFLGTALGFALASGPFEIAAIFMALGLGFAAPYLLVAARPELARLLPRPGEWMVTVRRLLGFALAGTALWLLSVLAAESGARAAAADGALLAAVTLAFIALRGLARSAAVAAFVALALTAPFIAKAPEAPTTAGLWRPFAPSSLGTLVHDGRVVFVDVTADWCLTCKLNERLVLDKDEIRRRLEAPGVVAMRADWTRPDPAIAEYLKRFGRYGIPFNAVYGPGAPAGLALPEILTADEVRDALLRAAGPSDGRG
jgi:suppressor for copper-sensitivity B